MLDPIYVRDNAEAVQQGLANRGLDAKAELQQLATFETQRRRLIPAIEGLKREQNATGDQVARAKRQGEEVQHLYEASKQRNQKIKQMEVELEAVERQRTLILETLPNLPHASVPVGKSAADNVVVRTWGDPVALPFEAKAHWDLGPQLGIIDFERATKISGSRFAILMGAGAQLERALINFMLTLHTTEHGYTEVLPPFLVSSSTLYGTGPLPKFADDAYAIERDDRWGVPTAEVPLTSISAGEILDEGELPKRFIHGRASATGGVPGAWRQICPPAPKP